MNAPIKAATPLMNRTDACKLSLESAHASRSAPVNLIDAVQ